MKDNSASEIIKRYRPLIVSLQPSARSWAEQQAKIEARRPTPDVRALRLEIVQRFAGSLPSASSLQPISGLGDGGDVAEMAVIVILMMVQDSDQDLQSKMLEAEAQMQANQALRALINEMQQLTAQLASVGEVNQGATCATPPGTICACAFNQGLEADSGATCTTPAQINCVCIPDVQLGANQGATCATPSEADTVGITSQQLASVITQLQNKLDSDNEVSELAMMRLQMLMDTRSKLLQTASDIEKSKSDSDMAVVANLK